MKIRLFLSQWFVGKHLERFWSHLVHNFREAIEAMRNEDSEPSLHAVD